MPATAPGRPTYRLPFVIAASAAGTIIEWYDFYLYGVLAAFFSTQFFPKGNDTAALLASLATFGAGFAVRPFGAAFFGRLGDLTGRKFTFLLTITIMGVSTALVGVLPTYTQIGILAPIILVILRLAQGLALGGEYGGAAIYVAEHSPDNKRGQNTSWIQTTATIGLLLALLLIGITRASMSADNFTSYGWRIPFILSIVLVAMALYIRLRLQETPLFSRLKAAGRSSTSPWRLHRSLWAAFSRRKGSVFLNSASSPSRKAWMWSGRAVAPSMSSSSVMPSMVREQASGRGSWG
jgi:MFS family permease